MTTPHKQIRHSPDTVAVIGLGVAGLAATKNLVEQGFNVVAFERNPSIGGLWTYNTDPNQTTVLKTTKANGSKQSSCYHDFPFPDDVPDYPTAQQTSDYMHNYARHCGLEKHFRLKTAIEYISPSRSTSTTSSTSSPLPSSPSKGSFVEQAGSGGQSQGWDLQVRDDDGVSTETFDRVVVTSGPWGKPYMPDIPGLGEFKGKIIHAQAYKGSEGFEGKNVVVVGMSNTGCDVAVDLCKGGAEVYISHRSGVRLLKRTDPPLDHQISRRRFRMGAWMNESYPNLTSVLANRAMAWKLGREMPEIKKEWGLSPAPPLASSPGVVNDQISILMAEGKIHNLFGVVRLSSTGVITRSTSLASPPSTSTEKVEEVETPADVVIFSTAFDFDYSFLSPEADPSNYPQPEWEAIRGQTNNLRFPRLYQTMFHLDHPQSLAFIGPWRGFSIAAFSNSDLISQVIAQVWKGKYPLPGRDEMDAWVEKDYQRAIAQAKVWRIGKIGSEPRALETWLNDVAGTGVNEKLGWGMEGWKFWWSDRKLYGLIMDGVNSPHVYKLFEGKPGSREKWDGAREAIFKANGKA